MASHRSLRGLDGANFFVANVQTGFGSFIAVYLTTQAWTQVEIGQALSVGMAAAMLSQLPAGALVDRLADKRWAAALAGLAIALSAALFALAPVKPAVMAAEILHSCASSMLGPAIAALTLSLVGQSGLGERLGRNARFASLGTGVSAAVLGVLGTYVSSRAVFWLSAALMLPALLSLRAIRRKDLAVTATAVEAAKPNRLRRDVVSVLTDGRVMAFAACAALFQLASAALLPLAASNVTRSVGSLANLYIAACIVLPQGLVAVASPWVGRLADRRGFRLILVLGFAAVPLRAVLFAFIGSNPVAFVAVQSLDGLSAAAFGVVMPLLAARLMQGTGRFNLCIGVFGLASAAGATVSTLLAGQMADGVGDVPAFLLLAGCGVLATVGSLLTPLSEPPRCGPEPTRPDTGAKTTAPTPSDTRSAKLGSQWRASDRLRPGPAELAKAAGR
jgi:MFS family permease